MHTIFYAPRIFLSFLIAILFVPVFGQINDYQIGGNLYDYNLEKIDHISSKLLLVQDERGRNVDYELCTNPISHPDWSFTLCLKNFTLDQLPVSVILNPNNNILGISIKDAIISRLYLLGKYSSITGSTSLGIDINCSGGHGSWDFRNLSRRLLNVQFQSDCNKNVFFLEYDRDFVWIPREYYDTATIFERFWIERFPHESINLTPICVGDANGSKFGINSDAELSVEKSSHDSMIMNMTNLDLEQDRSYEVNIFTKQSYSVLAFQMGFQLDSMFRIDSLKSSLFKSSVFNNRITNNELRVVYANLIVDSFLLEKNFITLYVTALKSGKLSDAFLGEVSELPHRVVMKDLSVRPIKFVFETPSKANVEINPSIGLTVSPNPSSEELRINMSLPQGINEGIFSIYNSLGKLMSKTPLTNINEFHQLIIAKDKFPNTGLYIGTLETEKGRQVVEILRL